MGRKKKLVNHSDIPDYVIERIARAFYPDILASFQSEEGQQMFAEWKAEQAEKKKKTGYLRPQINSVNCRNHFLRKGQRGRAHLVCALPRWPFFICSAVLFLFEVVLSFKANY